MLCPACVAEMPDEDLFCENCGLKLGEPVARPQGCVCGAAAGETDEDGFCLTCGRRVRHASSTDEAQARQPDPTDHVEQALSPAFAAVSDRGLRHAKNEDRFGIFETAGRYAVVVCDGVSTSRNAEIASTAVAEGVLESLSASMRTVKSGEALDSAAAIREAISAGAARLAGLPLQSGPDNKDDNPPSTTVVAALVANGWATIAWLGDSRAYWIDPSGSSGSVSALQLTQDHSWLSAVVASGEMTAEQAAKSPKAHAISRWIGRDACGEFEIDVIRHSLAEASNGILLLCTDGLWNYFPTPEAMAGIVRNASREDQDALTIARDLVQLANRRGGHDNITAGVLRYAWPESAGSGPVPREG
jgi:serine/threonine protein phosphatase PrpC